MPLFSHDDPTAHDRAIRWTIHAASAAAAAVGTGLAGLPVADTLAIVQIQTAMVTAIGRLHGADPTYAEALQLALAVVASATGRGVDDAHRLGGWGRRLARGTTAAALTQAVGWAAVRAFSDAGERG